MEGADAKPESPCQKPFSRVTALTFTVEAPYKVDFLLFSRILADDH